MNYASFYKYPHYILNDLFPCRYAEMIGSKHTDYVNILRAVEANGGEVLAGPVIRREFNGSREKFTTPIQESSSSATGVLV